MRLSRPVISSLFALILTPAFASLVTDTAQVSDGIHSGGPETVADYYGSGADDGFFEYGIASFNTASLGGQFTTSTFGNTVTSINSATYTLTVNDRGFSDGTQVQFFLITDDFDNDFSSLFYDDFVDDVTGLDPSQYTTAPISLGTYSLSGAMDTLTGGSTEVFNLGLSPAAESAMVNSINSGSEFSISIHATGFNDDITFSGVGNTFDPGDPQLAIDADVIPEPTTFLTVVLFAAGLFFYKRSAK